MTQRRTFRQSLITSYFLISLVPLGFIGIFILLFIYKTVADDFKAKIGMLSQSARGQIQLYLDQPVSVLHNISNMIDRSFPAQDQITSIMNSQLVDSTYFESIYLLDRYGRVINAGLPTARESYRNELLGINLGHKPEFRMVRTTGKAQWSDTFLSLSSGKISLTLYMPSGDLILAADINLNALARYITQLSRDDVVSAVLDRNGTIIIHPEEKLMGNAITMNRIDIVSQALRGNETTGTFTFQGKHYLGSTRIINPTGWICLFAEPRDHLIGRLAVPLLIFAIGLGGAVVLCLLLALNQGKRFARPITEMTEQSTIISTGAYARTMPTNDIAELGQLAEAINSMAEAIKQRETQLRESEMKYREFVENTSNLILRLERNFSISYANHTIRRLTGMSPDQAVTMFLADFLVAEDWQAMQRSVADWLAKNLSSATIEARIKHQDGTIRHLLLTANLHYDPDNHLSDLNIIGHDITDRLEFEQQQRNLEHRRQQSQKMELLGLMAGGVAHDLNNILAGIINYPELLLLKLDQHSPIRPTLESIKKSGERAAAVVADLLTVARGSAAVHKITDLNELIENFCQSPEFQNLRDRFPEVDFSFQPAERLWRSSCSPVHIEKSLMNLVANGFEAVVQNGTIELFTENIDTGELPQQVQNLTPGRYVRLRVKDNGKGVPPEDQESIFEPFFSKKKMGRSGTGLGLTVAWSTVREHGGTITLSSDQSGSEFSVYLPATDEEPEQATADRPLAEFLGSGQHILVVDDEAQLREIASHMLAELNYRTTTVSSGEEALAYLEDGAADLVLLDMQMGSGLNGEATYERICSMNPSQKAIIVTGYSTSREVEATLRRGAGGFVKKPFSMIELGRALRQELLR